MKEGVYSCLVFLDPKRYKGMCYYDIKRENILEVHIFDFDDNIYGRYITVQIERFIRKPQKYISFSHMKELIKNDAKHCLSLLDDIIL